ncbi:TonB-dependent receptor [Rhodocytophaga aerolata]|uniref:TonB-dependent receptor n=1 Tax=Rhodocytophaga aerolata TaxID=455078 RepID=A0ABT8RE39_9BACT|nr:TonB-dependent receptor [Rhodocytophaga aerolata]MDO1450367.1 TonB-dependent receptor [Rhodocytophaga aerolata]
MNYFNRLVLLLVSLFLFCNAALCQTTNTPLISGDFVDVSFRQFVDEVESKTPYFFYYDSAHTDTLRVTIRVQEKPLNTVLRQLFNGKELYFAIDAQNRVYISKGNVIRTELPIGFFENTEPASTTYDVAALDYLEDKEKSKVQASLANKLYEIGKKTASIQEGRATISGQIRSAESGEPVIGALLFIEQPRIGVATDQLGNYSITLPKGRHELKIKNVGMKDTRRQIMLYADGKLDIELQNEVVALNEVVVQAEKDRNVTSVQMGVERLDIKTIKQVPTVFGEADVLKVVLTLPGVKTVGEGSNGFNVRGGATDQNLILFNEATIYNPSHLFGFFSAFNPDIIKNVELYKSGIPAKYGGRLSSVLEINSRDGDKKKFAGSGGIGLITGRLTLEGPIIKDKTSFIVGARSTYSDWLLKQLQNASFNRGSASFYDVNLHISHEVNKNNNLHFTGYLSRDRFQLGNDTLYGYRNQNATLRWAHIFNNRLSSEFTGGFSRYQYDVSSDKNPVNAYDLSFEVNQSSLKADFSYFLAERHNIDFGVSTLYYKLFPGSYLPKGSESFISPNIVEPEQALESALYVSDEFEVSPKLSVNIGLRYSLFNYLGPKNVAYYPIGIPKEEGNSIDTIAYTRGDFIKTYHGPEYRLSARYALNQSTSLKASYNKMRQYMHMLSNTTAISPTDIWKLSDVHVKPQIGDQVSVGLYKNFFSGAIETSVETYYKTMANFLDYKSGALLILNHHIETDIINAEGKAYGVEVMVKKPAGKLNGWMSYTYSRSLLRANDPVNAEVINQGEYYPSNFDKPHDFTFIGNYKFNRRINVSLNFTYSTGRPITLPLAKYSQGGAQRIYYSDRNQYRIPDYYRADVAMNIEGSHKIKKLAHSSWTISIYNVTGRRNAYSVYFTSERGSIKGYKLSIFGMPIPTVTYNFRF